MKIVEPDIEATDEILWFFRSRDDRDFMRVMSRVSSSGWNAGVDLIFQMYQASGEMRTVEDDTMEEKVTLRLVE